MNVKVLKGETGAVVGHYVSAGDSITSQEARGVVTAAHGGQLLGVFDHGEVVGLVAVDPQTGEILGTTSLPGVDISAPIDRVVDHYSVQSRRGRQGGGDYRPQRPRQPRRHTQRPIGNVDLDTEDIGMGYDDGYGEGYEDLAYDDAPMPNNDGNWNHETRDNSDFINSWGADEETGVVDPGSSGQIKWPGNGGPEPINTMTSNSAVMSYATAGKTKKKKPVVGIVFGVLFLLLIAGGIALYLTGTWEPLARQVGILKAEEPKDEDVEKSTDPVSVSIPDGYGSGQIAELLLDAGIIDDMGDFHKEVVRQTAESSLKSGSYVFTPGMPLSEIVETLVKGPNDTSSRLTVPEGLSLDKTAALVESSFGIPADQFKERAKASNYVADYPFLADAGDNSLEGYLFPKTYDFAGKTPDADMIIRKMLDQFKQEISIDELNACKDEINAKYNLSLSSYDLIKLASIVEREATNDDDRPKVASVFYNRLGRECPGLGYIRPYLESDATMAYVVGHEVTPEDLKQENPYNTYLTKGLTPTPIANPSVESIKAAMHPADTNNFYFFIVEKPGYSNHTFSETYDQHQEVIANAKREMAEKGIS